MKLVSRVLCFAVFVTVLRAGQASTVGAEYYAGGNEVRSTSGKLVGLESKIAIENNVLRKENMRLKQFLTQSSVLEKDASNNIDLVSYIQEKEQAPKLCVKLLPARPLVYAESNTSTVSRKLPNQQARK